MLIQMIALISLLMGSTGSTFFPAKHSFPFNQRASVISSQFHHTDEPQEIPQLLIPPRSTTSVFHPDGTISSNGNRRFVPASSHVTPAAYGLIDRQSTAFHHPASTVSHIQRNIAHTSTPITGSAHILDEQSSVVHPPASAYIPPPLHSGSITGTGINSVPSPSVLTRFEHRLADRKFGHRPSQSIDHSGTVSRFPISTSLSRRQFDRNFLPHSSQPITPFDTTGSTHEHFDRNFVPQNSQPFAIFGKVPGLSISTGSTDEQFNRNLLTRNTQPFDNSGLPGLTIPSSSTHELFDRNFLTQNTEPFATSGTVPRLSIPTGSTNEQFNRNFELHPSRPFASSAQRPISRHSISDPVLTQYRNQDGSGRYNFGYDGDSSSRHETKDADGTVRGSYSYLDSFGKIQSQNYVADRHGFRVLGTNLPVGPSRKKRFAGSFPASTGPLLHHPWFTSFPQFGYNIATFNSNRFHYGDPYGTSFGVN